MSSSTYKNVVRACDSCLSKKARWYCASDDAFLCQACDSSIHSANPLARRHERIVLKTVSSSPSDDAEHSNSVPSWHHGFTKKARTPRHGKKHYSSISSTPQTPKCLKNHPFHLVPEEGSDEVNSHEEENEEQLLYRVPIMERPFEEAEYLCRRTPPPSSSASEVVENKDQYLQGFLASDDPDDVELAEFAADVESLLGKGLESDQCVGMEELGLNHGREEEDSWEYCGMVKFEDQEEGTEQREMGIIEPFDYYYYYYDQSHGTCDEVKVNDKMISLDKENGHGGDDEGKKKKLLHLDYEAIITAWAASHKSPWTTGDKPDLDLNQCMGTNCGTELYHPYGELGGFGWHQAEMADRDREARVSRYREKRRTRLFSKKIRYEVRKLNAEKRPRMKGRFVKRASIAPPTFPLLNNK